MVQRTANENAACLRRICKRSDQPKIERIANNDARLIPRSLDLGLGILQNRQQSEGHPVIPFSCKWCHQMIRDKVSASKLAFPGR